MKDLGVFDYVILGAGTAGCVLANRLSADPGVRVALLEAGGEPNYLWINIPVGYLYCMGNPRTDWCFKTAATPGLNGRVLNYPRGRVLGGCSAINGMLYVRGQARDYDHWRQLGNSGWGWEDVLPYFTKSEDQGVLPADELHGRGGEWRVEAQRLSWEILDAFRDAAATSTAATTRAAATSRSINGAAGAGTRQRPSSIRSRAARTSRSSPRHRSSVCAWRASAWWGPS